MFVTTLIRENFIRNSFLFPSLSSSIDKDLPIDEKIEDF